MASIVLRHHDWERGKDEAELEAAIVYLADKWIQGTRRVSLKERFERSRARCAAQPDAEKALEAWEKRYRQAAAIETELMKKVSRRVEYEM